MDMNRKSRYGLKNLTAASLLKKLVLVLALFFMMVATGHAGAFLDGTPDLDTSNNVVFNPITLTNGDTLKDTKGNQYLVGDRRRLDIDLWAPHVYSSSPEGYIGSDYKAGSPDYSNDVYYIGTFSGNYGDEKDLLPLLQYFMDDTSLTNLGYEKMDDVFDDIGSTTTFEGTNFTVNVTDTKTNDDGTVEALGGTWEFEKNSSAETIDFYVVKGGPEYALYYVNPAQSSGTWTTAHLLDTGEQRGLSYLSVMKTTDIIDNPPENPGAVPEPATMLLFGFSLMGLAGVARRKNSKF